MLGDAKDLAEICIAMEVQIPPRKAGKRSAIFSLILKHLMSTYVEDSEDAGLALIQDIAAQVETKIQKAGETKVKTEQPKTTETSTGKDGETSTKDLATESAAMAATAVGEKKNPTMSSPRDQNVVRTTVERIRLEKFKVYGGSIGGEKNRVDYKSLVHQIQEAKGLGHSMKEIMSGIVRAMESGSGLKRWFEKRPDVTEEKAMKMLRSHYEMDVKDSMTLMTELKNSVQEPTETVKDYVMRMMDLRDTVVDLSEEEECPLQERHVTKRFYEALSVGITVDVIRLELQSIFKQASLEDDELMAEINQVVARYEEHKKKQRPKNAKVNNMNAETENAEKAAVEEKVAADNLILAELKKLNKSNMHLTAKVNEMSTMKCEIADLKMQFAQQKNGGGDAAVAENVPALGGRKKKLWFVKCEECAKTRGSFCNHCTTCGSPDHKRHACPLKSEN